MKFGCESARRLTPDRLPRVTPPVLLDVPDIALEIGIMLGARLDADRGQSSGPIHNLLRQPGEFHRVSVVVRAEITWRSQRKNL